MKRTVSLVLVLLVLFSAALFFPRQTAGAVSVDDCYNNHSRCRQLALGSDMGWIKMTLMLTACDLGFGVCLYHAN